MALQAAVPSVSTALLRPEYFLLSRLHGHHCHNTLGCMAETLATLGSRHKELGHVLILLTLLSGLAHELAC